MNPPIREDELAAVDEALRTTPPVEPPPALVRRTLDAVAGAAKRRQRMWRVTAMVTALATILLSIGVGLLMRPKAYRSMPGSEDLETSEAPTRGPESVSTLTITDPAAGVVVDMPAPGEQTRGHDMGGQGGERGDLAGDMGRFVPAQEVKNGLDDYWSSDPKARPPGDSTGELGDRDGELRQVAGADGKLAFESTSSPRPVGGTLDESQVDRTIIAGNGWIETKEEEPALASMLDGQLRVAGVEADRRSQLAATVDKVEDEGAATARETMKVTGLLEAAQDDANRDRIADKRVEALAFIPARGYFANTYIPGDRERVRLDLTKVQGKVGGESTPLEVTPVAQPFDRPVGQALSLQLAADRTAIEGRTRLTLQVGLAGAAPVKARRAPLDVALIVDVASVADEAERQALWSLADALVAERQEGDAFAVVVPRAAGPEVLSGQALTPDAVARSLAAAAEERRALDADVLAAAYTAVRAARRAVAEAPRTKGYELGASAVVLASAGPIGPDVAQAIARRAHAEALDDVQLSLVGAGARVDRDALGELAQRGQGRRWIAATAADARRVVGDELASAGRTVARALRLRIRLAPGVQLVEVLGSHPLTNVDTTRTREAERAIDQRLERDTGIRADRGEDEDGIQIVIPAFMAGDDHTILLDVVAPGPGPVLDVHARWKDLVRMDNVEAHASLTLPSGADQASPLALNVVENRAAMLASQALLDVARLVAAGDPQAAQPRLSNVRAELDHLARRAPAARDEVRLVDRYQTLLQQAPAWMQDEEARDEVMRALESSWRTLR